MKRKATRSRIMLIATGIALGYLARFVIGPPAAEAENPNQFHTPLPDQKNLVIPEEEYNLDIIRDQQDQSGMVPPVQFPVVWETDGDAAVSLSSVGEFLHDEHAEFEPHGEQVCASGCALSRHPTGTLTHNDFSQLIKQYASGPLDSTNDALEELLFFGPQTRKLASSSGLDLTSKRADFLRRELRKTHAKVSLRVIDSNGVIRTWLDPTRVPFDRRHVFDMKTENLQPLVTSGTVKRVGLEHLWVRL